MKGKFKWVKYFKLGLKVFNLDCKGMAAITKLWPFPDPVPLVSWKLNFEISDFHPASFEAVVHNCHTLHMTYSSYFHGKLLPEKCMCTNNINEHQKLLCNYPRPCRCNTSVYNCTFISYNLKFMDKTVISTQCEFVAIQSTVCTLITAQWFCFNS